MRPDHLNSLSLKILAINPYNSKILILCRRGNSIIFIDQRGRGTPSFCGTWDILKLHQDLQFSCRIPQWSTTRHAQYKDGRADPPSNEGFMFAML